MRRISINFALFYAGILFLSNRVCAAEKLREELIVVQTVSKERHSFVVSKGIRDGIFKGQEIVFASENASILCKAQEVSRDFSLWVPVNAYLTVPFKKEEIISFNTSAYGNVALDIVGDYNRLTPINYYKVYHDKFVATKNISAKAGLNRGLAQTSSDVSADNNASRAGYSFSAEYNYRVFPEVELSLGARYDSEVYRITTVALDIPTTRLMATIAGTYHLLHLSNGENNFYIGVALGLGRSTTIINEIESSGTVKLLPEARFGFLMPFARDYAMVFESSIESLSATEKVGGEIDQTTNILNAKLTLGLRF